MRAIWTKRKVIARSETIAIAKLIVYQIVITLCVTLILALMWNKTAAISALFGGLLVWAPNIVMAIFIFSHNAAHDPKKIVRGFYAGEIVKIIVTALLLIAVLHFYAIMLMPLLIGIMMGYLVYLLVKV